MGRKYLLLRVRHPRPSANVHVEISFDSYMVSQYPLAWLMQRMPMGKFLGTCSETSDFFKVIQPHFFTGTIIFLWAVTLMTTAACKNFAGAMVNRFVLGCLEAAITYCDN